MFTYIKVLGRVIYIQLALIRRLCLVGILVVRLLLPRFESGCLQLSRLQIHSIQSLHKKILLLGCVIKIRAFILRNSSDGGLSLILIINMSQRALINGISIKIESESIFRRFYQSMRIGTILDWLPIKNNQYF